MAKGRRLRKPLRQRLILAESRATASVRVAPLAARLGVSTETIRRDLQELHEEGLLARIYGGATTPPSRRASDEEPPSPGEESTRLGAAAVQGLRQGQVVMLGGGAAAREVARQLTALSCDLVVLTNSPRIAAAASAAPSIEAVLCPGRYLAREAEVVGEDAVLYLQQFRADVAIIEPLALSAEGPFEENPMIAAVKRVMLQRSVRRILLAGSHAWRRTAARGICPLDLIDEVIFAGEPPGTFSKAIAGAGGRLSPVGLQEEPA